MHNMHTGRWIRDLVDSELLKRRQHYENPRTYILDSIGEINLLFTDNDIFFSEESVLLSCREVTVDE